MTIIEEAVTQLAEATKELVRIIQCYPNYGHIDQSLKNRLDTVYKKAVVAKDLVSDGYVG